MILTDDHLSSLTNWVQRKLALRRFVDGWGVACGFEVRCDPSRPAGVVVGPGYALSPCGEDIVVCEPQHVDLTGCCNVPDPCAVPAVAVAMEAQSIALDLYIRYREVDGPQIVHTSGSCGCGGSCRTGRCEPDRILEGYELVPVRPSRLDSNPYEAEATQWEADYQRCATVVQSFATDLGEDPAPRDSRDWLVRWLDEHPELSLCGLRRRLCALETDDELGVQLTGDRLLEVLFEIVTACRPPRRRHPLPQPRRRPIVLRTDPTSERLRRRRQRRRTDQGRRRMPARSLVQRRRPRPQDRPDPGRPLPPPHDRRRQTHTSALCTISTVLLTRIAACLRAGHTYQLRDVDGATITEAVGRRICTERYTIPAPTRAARRSLRVVARHPRRNERTQKGVAKRSKAPLVPASAWTPTKPDATT
jgi:hypothetical protein